MDKDLLEKITQFRRDIHQNAEVSFREFQTHKKIKNMLLGFNIPENSIKEFSKEGQ